MKFIKISMILTILFSLFGCANTMHSLQRTSETFNNTKDEIWPIIISEIGIEYPIQVIEKESGLISTQGVNIEGSFDNFVNPTKCMLNRREMINVRMGISVFEIQPEKTKVMIKTHYMAYELYFMEQFPKWRVAHTNGRLENRILNNIEQKLR